MKKENLILFLTALALIAGAAGAVSWLKAHQRLGAPGVKFTAVPGSLAVRLALPERAADFESTNVPESQVELDYFPKDTSFTRRVYYLHDDLRASLTVVLMGADRTSIHKPDYCLPGQGWQIRDKQEVKLSVAGAQPYELPVMKWTVANTVTAPDGTRQSVSGLYVFWFVTEGRTTDSFPEMLKSMFVHQLAHGVLQRWAYVSVFTACLPGQEDAAFAQMKQLIAGAAPEFQPPPAAK
jgi:Protein of unknown function (DUF3485)